MSFLTRFPISCLCTNVVMEGSCRVKSHSSLSWPGVAFKHITFQAIAGFCNNWHGDCSSGLSVQLIRPLRLMAALRLLRILRHKILMGKLCFKGLPSLRNSSPPQQRQKMRVRQHYFCQRKVHCVSQIGYDTLNKSSDL